MRTKQKILQISKSRFITLGFAILVNVILAGSVCGTFAWYTYATRTGFLKEYHGTTVGDVGALDAGIVSNVRLPNFEQYKLSEDATTLADEGKYIYWCEGRIEAATINYVIGNNGSATTIMDTVTSAAYDSASGIDGFHLYQKPKYLFNYGVNADYYAPSASYVFIPFVFRYAEESNPDEFVSNMNIYFDGCAISTSEDQRDLYKAARLFMSDKTNGYLINPTEDDDGTNAVGGILDLDKDGFYDYTADKRELIYGETISSEYNDEATAEDGDLPTDERTTFIANHKQGVFAVNESTYQPKTVNYCGMRQFRSRSTPITSTNSEYHNLACLDMYIYFEGWDTHAVDKEQGSGFNMDLEFGVNI